MERPSGAQRELRAAVNPLGHGSYGFCLAVTDIVTGEPFCIKVPKGGNERPVARASLAHEYETLARLEHPNLVRALAWVSSRAGDVHGW